MTYPVASYSEHVNAVGMHDPYARPWTPTAQSERKAVLLQIGSDAKAWADLAILTFDLMGLRDEYEINHTLAAVVELQSRRDMIQAGWPVDRASRAADIALCLDGILARLLNLGDAELFRKHPIQLPFTGEKLIRVSAPFPAAEYRGDLNSDGVAEAVAELVSAARPKSPTGPTPPAFPENTQPICLRE